MTISIIIPSFNEGNNLREITRRIQAALCDYSADYELWFIDDSTDETPDLLATLASEHPEVHFHHRTNARGLGSAVIEGFARSKGEYVIVMDADLQHPPELLPAMINQLKNGADIVIPSRFIAGGSDGGLNPIRKLVSFVARKIGQLAIKRFRSISDCTSGYFGFKRSVINNTTLNCLSWKILMEVLMKGTYSSVKEIPYQFMARDAGESKMNLREQVNYLWHIAKLVLSSPSDRRFYLFCFFGFLSLGVNLVVFNFMLKEQLPPMTASIIASLVSMLHNYLWHDSVTWKSEAKRSVLKRVAKFPQYVLVSTAGIITVAVLVKLFVYLQLNPLYGQLSGIGIATFWNYHINRLWTWRAKPTDQPA